MDCTAFGVPSPQITWLRLQENSDRIETLEDLLKAKELEANGALWQVLAHNNSLKFRSYSSEDYSSEVHKASYVCKASSESGTILSRSVNVKSGRKTYSQPLMSDIQHNMMYHDALRLWFPWNKGQKKG